MVPYATEKSPISLQTKPTLHFVGLFVFFASSAVDAYDFMALLDRRCVECQHFKRGDYIEDNSCSRICKDEIKVVDQISE